MSFRTTLVLLFLAVVLGAYAWFFERGEQPDTTKAEETAVFDDTFDAKDVQKLDITSPQGTVTLERAGDAKWTLSTPAGARADKMLADGVADTLAHLKATRKLDDPKNLGAFGLDKPGIKIDMTLKGKPAPRTLLMGEKTVDNTSVYTKRGDAAAVYLIPTTLQSQVSKQPEEWRDKSLAAVEFSSVVGVEVERPEGKLAFEKQGEGWMMTEPTKIPASKDEVEGIIRETTGLRVEKFVKDGATAADLPEYGLDKPRYTVRLRVGGTASTQVLFGELEAKPSPTPHPAETTAHPGKGKATPAPPATPTTPAETVNPADKSSRIYAKLSDENSVLLVPASLLPRLDKKVDSFYSLQPFVTQQWQVQRLELKLKDLSLVLSKDDKGEWTLAEPEGKSVDYGRASGVLSAVFGVKFEGLGPEGTKLTGDEQIVVTGEKKGDAEAPTETLRIGQAGSDGVRFVQREGESWVYRMKDSDLDSVRTAAKSALGLDATPTAVAAATAVVAATPAVSVATPVAAGTPVSIVPKLAPGVPTPH
jgi:Domain of unknown function (DUF4340)